MRHLAPLEEDLAGVLEEGRLERVPEGLALLLMARRRRDGQGGQGVAVSPEFGFQEVAPSLLTASAASLCFFTSLSSLACSSILLEYRSAASDYEFLREGVFLVGQGEVAHGGDGDDGDEGVDDSLWKKRQIECIDSAGSRHELQSM